MFGKGTIRECTENFKVWKKTCSGRYVLQNINSCLCARVSLMWSSEPDVELCLILISIYIPTMLSPSITRSHTLPHVRGEGLVTAHLGGGELMNNKKKKKQKSPGRRAHAYTLTPNAGLLYNLASPCSPYPHLLLLPACLCMEPCFICIGRIIPPVVTGTDDTGCIKNDDPPTDCCVVGTHKHTLLHTETVAHKQTTNKHTHNLKTFPREAR